MFNLMVMLSVLLMWRRPSHFCFLSVTNNNSNNSTGQKVIDSQPSVSQLTRFIGNQWCLTPDRNSRSSHFRSVWDLRASSDVEYFGCFSVFKSVSSSVSLFSWILRRCFYCEAPEVFWSVASDPSPSLKLSPRSGRRPAAQSDCQIEIKTVFTATTRRMNADPTNYRKNMNQTWDH